MLEHCNISYGTGNKKPALQKPKRVRCPSRHLVTRPQAEQIGVDYENVFAPAEVFVNLMVA
jgi:hypothetical protein